MTVAVRPEPPFTIRRLNPLDAAIFRDLRLEGLRDHPEAFGAAWEEETQHPLPWFAQRLERNAVFGGWLHDEHLAGVAGLFVPETLKQRHKGTLWGMYVRPVARGSRLAAALVERVVEHASSVVEEVRATVVTSNAVAVRLYTRLGFREYGLERRALKVGGQYYDELLLIRPLNRSA